MNFPFFPLLMNWPETDRAVLRLLLDSVTLKVFSNLNVPMISLYEVTAHDIWIILDLFEKGLLRIFDIQFFGRIIGLYSDHRLVQVLDCVNN